MKTYEFGITDNPTILLIPGTCCHWRLFDDVIPLLEEHFHVVVISFTGFDETEPETVFTTELEETEKIENYVLQHHNGSVFAAYGCSLGGSIVALMVQRKRTHIDHAFIGSSDLDQAGPVAARLQTAIVAPLMHKMLTTGKLPRFMQKRLEAKPQEERAYMEKFMKAFGIGEGARDMSFVRRESIKNQFYSDLVTPLDDNINAPGTLIHVFYATKMGEKYLARYQKHFANPNIRRHDMNHEELLFAHPNKWCAEILACCGV